MELIGKQIAIETILGQPPELHYPSWYARQIEDLPPAPPEYLAEQAGILVTDADTISRQAAIEALSADGDTISRASLMSELKDMHHEAEKWVADAKNDDVKARAESCLVTITEIKLRVDKMPPVQPEQLGTNLAEVGTDCISRQQAIKTVGWYSCHSGDELLFADNALRQLPPIQPKKEIAKRVLWTGWKGYRNTRYKCPNCKKPVKNDDIYCHRCGQKLMFPHISFTDYVPGEKQETIVRWDDE